MCDKQRKQSFGARSHAACTLLILGSLPGDASLCAGEYYAHPRNAFWKIMGEIFQFSPDAPYEQRCNALLAHQIALWDVVQSASRPGSLDSAITQEKVNDFANFLQMHPKITRIACNGGTAHRLFVKYCAKEDWFAQVEVIALPSTSPANARMTFAEKLEIWRSTCNQSHV